ncbi:MAG: dTMP kinase [Propionibacteriaceae bacterium]|jgi:dTMP kinase|nr:dTMP kinase [Propionibacteriaceae bacterium]
MADRSGLFIAFEGGDGSGKSTHARRLAQWLTDQGYRVHLTFEPGDTEVGASLRQIVLHSPVNLDVRAEALLYAADKAQHVAEVVRPGLDAGEIIICDRYVDSTIAYQGAGRALSVDDITRLAWWSVSDLAPDLTVVMDVSVRQAFAGKTDLDRMESAGVDFHERVRHHFLDLAAADPRRYLVVAGRGPIDAATGTIRTAVSELIDQSDRRLVRV